MRWRFTPLLAFLGLFAVLLPATATGARSSKGGSKLAKGHYTLTVFASQGWVLPAEQQGLAQRFKKLTGITVKYDLVPSANYQNILVTKLATGQMPGDIYMGQPSQSALELTYAVKQHAVDLTDQPWVKYEDPAIRAQSTLHGKVYGQSVWDFASGAWVVVYNKNDFASAGITSVPRTFASFLSDCQALKAKGITPLYEPMGDGWHEVLWFAETGPQMEKLDPGFYTKLNENKATFAGSPIALQALTQINELYQDGCFEKTATTDQSSTLNNAMAGNNAAMTVWSVTTPTSINQINHNLPASDFGFFPMPILNNQYIPVNPQTPTKFVYKGGPHVAGAEEYLDFLAEPSSLHYAIRNETTTVTEDYSDVKPSWEKWTPAAKSFEKAYTSSPVPVMQVAVNYVGPQWGNIATDMVAMFTGQITPHQVLANIDMRRAQEAQAAGDPHWR